MTKFTSEDAWEGKEATPSPFSGIRQPKKRAFLAALVESGGNITRACQLAGIDRSTPYTRQWQEDAGFQVALETAKVMAGDALESEARRRAYQGVETPVGWYKGQPGAFVRKYSDVLLIFLLKRTMPEKYGDKVEFRGLLGKVDLASLPDEPLSRIAAGEDPYAVLAGMAHDAISRGLLAPRDD